MDLRDFDNEFFAIQHLKQEDDLSQFLVKQETGKGLEIYLKQHAKEDEKSGVARTYLIRRRDTMQIAAYFTLRTGLITVSRGFLSGFDTYTGIELANFAVNDNARLEKSIIPQIGSYLLVFAY